MDRQMVEELARLENIHWWFRGRREVILNWVRKLRRRRTLGRILDVGAGPGAISPYLVPFGSVYAFDPDPRALAYCRRKGEGRITVAPGSLPDCIPYRPLRFGLVLVLDVLEHVEDDEAALKAIQQVMESDGYLLVTVPAFSFLWSGHDVLAHHRRRYTRRGLWSLLQRAGFQVEEIRYFNSFLFPLMCLGRWWNRLRYGLRPKSDFWLPPRPVNELLARIFGAESRLGTIRFPVGGSLIALARLREREGSRGAGRDGRVVIPASKSL